MSLTVLAQQQALKADIAANNNTIPAGQPWTGAFAGIAIKNVPNSGDGNAAIAGWYSLNAAPNYFVWKSSVTRADVYHILSLDATVWDWNAYKTQSVTEQGAWTQMFMGDSAPMQNLNFRNGCFNIFSGSGAQNAQRAHIFACGRRLARNIEKLFAVAPTNAGGIVVGPNNGNTITDALASATNPTVMAFEGAITGDDVQNARNS